MSATFATRLTGSDGMNLRKYVLIRGVTYAFQEDSTDIPEELLTDLYTRMPCISALSTDRRELDMIARRAKGGGLRLRLQDDASGTLRSLFTTRKRRITYIAENVDETSDIVTIKSMRALPDAGQIWVAGECITYAAKEAGAFADVLTGCTRGAFGTVARPLRGGTTNGQAVYDAPPSWVGRVLTLKGYFLEQDGTAPTDSAMQATLGTYEIDAHPQYLGDDQWELSAIDRIDGYMKKAIYSGIVPGGGSYVTFPPPALADQEADMFLQTNDLLKLFGLELDEDPGDFAFVLVEGGQHNGEDDTIPLLVRAVDLDSSFEANATFACKVVVNFLPDINRTIGHFQGFDENNRGENQGFTSARAVAYLREKANTLAYKVLLSRTGDGSNGSRDVLRGLESVAGETEPDVLSWRIGAAILEDDLDADSLAAVGSDTDWYYFVSDPITVADFMRDFCFATESFVLTNLNGQFAAKSMSDGPSSVVQMTIDDDMLIGKAKAVVDEANVFPRIIVESAYDPYTKEYGRRDEFIDWEMLERYPTNDQTLTIQSKTIHMMSHSIGWLRTLTTSGSQTRQRVRRYMCEEGGQPSLFIECTTHLDAMLLNLGDIVTLTVSDVPDMEGTTVENRRARVVSHLTEWDKGTCSLKLQVLRPPKRISPAAIIEAAIGSDTILTLSSGGAECVSGAELMFGVNNNVIVWDVSGDTYHETTLGGATGSSVTLDDAPPFAIEEGVDFLTLGLATDEDENPTQNGFTPLTDFIFQVDDDEREYEDNVPDAGESRWR